MSTATIPRLEDIRKARGDAPPANLPGHWIGAGTPTWEPYPCVCRYSPCRYEKCDDRLRTEGDALPPGCCGRRSTGVADDGFAVGRPADWKPAQKPVERSGVTGLREDGVSGAGDRLGGAARHACECVTPWDRPPPVLLIAAGKDGPVRESHRLPERVADVRGAADELLGVLGCSRAKPWKDGRHVLLPPDPGSRAKTRPCWHAQLADGRLAVLDTPDESGSGVHCPDCHENFANSGAWELHRRKGRYGLGECRKPGTVLMVEHAVVSPPYVDLVGRARPSALEHVSHGLPMLVRGAGGVWRVDPAAVWGAKGCPLSPEEISSVWTRAQEKLGARRRWVFGKGANRGAFPVL